MLKKIKWGNVLLCAVLFLLLMFFFFLLITEGILPALPLNAETADDTSIIVEERGTLNGNHERYLIIRDRDTEVRYLYIFNDSNGGHCSIIKLDREED